MAAGSYQVTVAASAIWPTFQENPSPALNVRRYGDSKQDAIQKAESAAHEIVLDRIAHGELPPDSAHAIFNVAA